MSLLVCAGLLGSWSAFFRPNNTANAQQASSTPPSFTFQQFLKQGPQATPVKKGPPSHYPQPPKKVASSSKTTTPSTNPVTLRPSAGPATMQPLTQPLASAFLTGAAGASALDLKGNDGRLEVQVQPGSLDVSQAALSNGAAPSGTLSLQISQVFGHFEGMTSTLGEYQFQVVDSQGQVVQGIKPRAPFTLLYHYQPSEMQALNLDPDHILLSWPTLIAAAQQAKQPTTSLVMAMRNDSSTNTLSAQSAAFGPGPFTMGNDGQNQFTPIPHVAEVQGNNGQVSYSYPLRVVPGSGGFTPQLDLTYSSMEPNDRHSNTSTAGDFGDGWSLSLGSITSETYPDTGATWYFLNGIDNVGDRLIATGSNNLYYTEHLSYLRIQQTTGAGGQPCFDIWDKSGTFYEIGCTVDSLEYSMTGTTRNNYQWNVDRIIAPNEGASGSTSTVWRILLISYLQDCGSGSSTQACSGVTIRDSAIKQITYGYSTSGGSLTQLTSADTAGTIDFTYDAPFSYTKNGVTWATAYTYGYGGNQSCTPAATTTLRCDDPVQKSGGFSPPDVMSTFSPLTITSYLGTDAATSNAAYAYTFNFIDSSFQSCTDPISGTGGYCAGEHVLWQITPYMYQNGAGYSFRSTTFGYTALKNTYYDSLHNGWNGPFNTSTTWNYLSSYQDQDTGMGESILYATAYSNTDGTPTQQNGQGLVTDDRFDALYCDHYPSDCSTGSYSGHYAHPDDHAWSVQVVYSLTTSGQDGSALSKATTTYNYYGLAQTGTYSGSGAWCYPDQNNYENYCVGDNWLPNNNNDWQDYYHAEFRGFAQTWHLTPSNDQVMDYYFSTEGWYKPATDPGDYLAGQLQLEEIYQGSTINGVTMLSKTVNTYPGPYAANGDAQANNISNPTACYTPGGSAPYAACDVMALNSGTYEYDEVGSQFPDAPWVGHTYTYDDYDPTPTTGGLRSGYHNLVQEQISGSNLPNASPNLIYPLTQKWSYAVTNETQGGWTYYIVDPVSHSEIDDASGHIWQCQYTSFDQGNTNPTPSAGWPTTVNTYSSNNCANQTNPPMTTTYAAYDAFGNQVANVDGVGAATFSLYSSNGCTPTSAIEIVNNAWTPGHYTSCASYDSAHDEALPISTANALNQGTGFSYDATQGNALVSTTDPNGQVTGYSYSYAGQNRTAQTTLPLDTTHYTSQANSYSTCAGGSSLPCYEVDHLSYQYSSVVSSTFYDSQGRAVETSTPGPAPANPQAGMAYYTIVYTAYNDAGHSVMQSLPFVVAVPNTQHGSGYIDPSTATDYNGAIPGGTATYYDALGRVIAIRDPLYGTGADGIACSTLSSNTYTACTNYTLAYVSGDSNDYVSVTSVDPDQHVAVSYLDALGRTVYTQQNSGTYGGTLTLTQQQAITYNALGEATQVVVTDEAQSGQPSVTTTAQYDDLGRLQTLSDPDRGTHTYTYDGDGRVLTDVSGTRTIGYSYDLLGRVGCVQNEAPTESATGACTSGATVYVKNFYDITEIGTNGSTDFPIGQLTKSDTTTRYPDGSNATVSVAYQHDKDGRLIDSHMSFVSLPSSWNITSALPSFKVQYSYNDANQLTTTQTSTSPSGLGTTTTQVYDSTTGVETGLSNNGTANANLATLAYNAQAQLAGLNFQTSTGSALSAETFGYDGNLRPQSATASWQSGSGNSGTQFSQTLAYDPASNLTSLSTTQAAVPGQSNSGGSETQVFCYDAQNRLVWAGNSGTPSCSGNGTPSLSGSLGAYSSSYAYTNLGQLSQGPLNGSGAYTYLYCSSSQPHQLTGLYASGATCSNKTGQVYASSYDAWGNVTSRTYSGTTATLSYDILDHLTQWYVSSTNQEQYIYDANGERVLRRSTTSSGTTLTVYAFGLEEHQYSGSGTNQSNIYYYSLGGRLIGSLDANGTTFYLTDALGSLLASFSNTANSASLKSNQLFSPYGTARYTSGTLNTAKGFTGQYNDTLTGLDYFNARYYDPVVGVFLSADKAQGNLQGMNPYAYVQGNPETYGDPTGRYMATIAPISQQGGAVGYAIPGTDILTTVINTGYVGSVTSLSGQVTTNVSGLVVNTFTRKQQDKYGHYNPLTDAQNSTGAKLSRTIGLDQLQQTWGDPNASWLDKLGAIGRFVGTNLNNVMQVAMILSGPEDDGIVAAEEEGTTALENAVDDAVESCGALSFASSTPVATSKGEQAIGTMQVGEKVWAYNPKTHHMELEPVLHVWINHDNDLVDLTLTTKNISTRHGKTTITRTSETLHTNKKHPFLTEEQGFLPVGQLKLGMHILEADGRYGVVTSWKVVPGVQVMYNLEVEQDHTYTVGSGQWVVHNCEPEIEKVWHPGSYNSAMESALDHYAAHGEEVGATSFDNYINKARGFMQNLRRASSSAVEGYTEGVIRYWKAGRYIDLAPDGRIISFGSRP